MKKRSLKRAAIAAPAVLAATSPTRQIALTYYPWITQSITGSVLQAALADFRSAFEAELRKGVGAATKVELLKEMEVPDQLVHLEQKPQGQFCTIGLLNPIGFALVHDRSPHIDAISVIQRKIGNGKPGPHYNAQLYTNRKTAIKTIRQMRGRTIAYGSPQSTSNFLVPAAMLWNYEEKEDPTFRIHPFAGFKRVDFAGGHDTAALAVYEGRADVGAGHDGVIFDLASKPGTGDAEQVLVHIKFSDDIPSDPVAIHTSEPGLKKEVQKALVRLAPPGNKKAPGNQIVKRFWGTDEGFKDTSAKAYTHLVDLMKKMTLRESDLLRRL